MSVMKKFLLALLFVATLWIHSGAEDHLLIEEHWRRAQ